MLTLSHAFQVFLAQPTFATRTRESYAEDLAPLMRTLGEAPISALTLHVATEFLAAQVVNWVNIRTNLAQSSEIRPNSRTNQRILWLMLRLEPKLPCN